MGRGSRQGQAISEGRSFAGAAATGSIAISDQAPTGPAATPLPLDHLALRGAPGDPALIVGDELLDYAALDAAAGRAAGALLGHGLVPGDRAASWMAKTRLACILPLACARAGLVHVPINPVFRRAQTAHILADSGARLLIANRARLDTLPPADRSEAAAVALDEWSEEQSPLPPSANDPHSLAALIYTSGSTGRAKGVMLTHANLWLGAVGVADYLGLTAADRTLALLPLAFDYGQNQLLSAWAAGGCAIGFDFLLARDVVRAVGRHRASVLAGVPPLWLQLAEADWSGGEGQSLRVLTNSGGHLPEALLRRLQALFPQAAIHLMYGLTEAFRSTSLDPAEVDRHPDSVGTAVPFAEVMVVRPDGSETGPGEEGELVHAGPLVARGYWRDEERTSERFRAVPDWSLAGGMAVWSGDRVVRDKGGRIRFKGRNDAMIKVSGNRVSPTEIEEAALASGAAADAAAHGARDPRLGQAIILVAVARGDRLAAEQRLRSYFLAELPQHMQPQRIVLLDVLPLGPNGKVDRARLQQDYQ